jgi:hypothetical protein
MAVHLGPGGESALTDLEVLQMRANEITDDSLESTRRMVQLVEEVSDLGCWGWGDRNPSLFFPFSSSVVFIKQPGGWSTG